MNVYTVTDHDGHWPVGTASVVVAETEAHARLLLDLELRKQGLVLTDKDALVLLDTDQPRVWVLCNGDY